MIRIITDSVAGIPASFCQKLGIEVVSMSLIGAGKEYRETEMDIEGFYTQLLDMADDLPTSSQPAQSEFLRLFSEAAEANDEVFGIFVSSKLSGTFNGALSAARSVIANHATFKYCLIDACSACFDEAFAVFAAVAARDAGCTLAQCKEQVLKTIHSSRIVFVPESLQFLKAGGRIGKASALVGSMVKILPMLTVTDGEVTVAGKVRTFKKALGVLFDQFAHDVEEHGLRNVVVQFIGESTPAKTWASEVIEPLCKRMELAWRDFPTVPVVPVVPASPVIGLHVGPAIGISYECKDEISHKITPDFVIPVYCS